MSRVGIIGGSGLYDIEGIQKIERVKIQTPFGNPSDDFTMGILENTEELEQLRVLEKGYRIKTVVTTAESIAVDTPEDLKKAEEWFAQSK